MLPLGRLAPVASDDNVEMAQSWSRSVSGGVEIDVWVVPGASRTRVTGVHDGALRVTVAAPPEKGQANRMLERLLTQSTGGAATVVRGRASRRKTVRIEGVDARHVDRTLSPPGPP